MGHLLTTSRVILARASLLMAALAVVFVVGVSAIDHAPFTQASSPAHAYHDASVIMERDTVRQDLLHHDAAHPDMAQCCNEEPVEPDCASVCAAMAGCPMQMVPGEGLIDIVMHNTGPISSKPAFHAAISTAPSTPPPKARI